MAVKQFTYQWPHHRFHAMGTRIDAWSEAAPAEAALAFAQVESLFRDVETSLSRFNPFSELSKLNAQPEMWVPVSKTLWNVLTTSLKFAEETGGMFDPTLLGAIRVAGYRESFERIKNDDQVEPVTDKTSSGGWRAIRLDAMHQQVWLPRDVGLDFGGIAKGYTAQWATVLMGLWGPCLIDAGGDLVAGDAPAGMSGWPVTILAPASASREDDRALVSLSMANSALATSGVDQRRWRVGGHEAHHLIDPATMHPARTDALTVSVMAPSGSAAEAWSKVALIAGTAGLAALSSRNMPALIVTQDGKLVLNEEMQFCVTGFDDDVEVTVHRRELDRQTTEFASASTVNEQVGIISGYHRKNGENNV